MSSLPGRILRHWTINSSDFTGRSQRPAPTLPYSERRDGGQLDRLAVKLADVKSQLAHRAS
jgi:hypothetical protein